MGNIFLTIVVPIRNMESRLSSVESWLREIPRTKIEVLFIVDNSTDSTFGDLIRIKDTNEYLFMSVQNGNFGGPGEARNVGLKSAQGQWVAFWDSDDKPNVENFISMVNKAEKSHKDFALGSWRECLITQNDTCNLKMVSGHQPTIGETIRNPGIWRWAFRRTQIQNHRFPNILMGEDQIFLANINLKWRQVYRDKEYVYTYVKGFSGQLTQDTNALKSRNKLHKHFGDTIKFMDFSCLSIGIRLKIQIRRILWWVQSVTR
jgi:glycosyltransferase involved in cell wall biosynthesis